MKYYLAFIILILSGLLFLFLDMYMRGSGAISKKCSCMEGFEVANDNINGNSLCSLYSSKPAELNNKCNSLTETNCNVTSCCVWLNGEKCVAGNEQGPTFMTTNGKNIDVKSYSFMGKLNK